MLGFRGLGFSGSGGGVQWVNVQSWDLRVIVAALFRQAG